MKLLIVGGTADGRHLATELDQLGFEVIYSIAGIVRKATLPCPVVTGGFSQFGGLQQYVIDNEISHIVDVTHPFAAKMSNKIAQVSVALSLPAIRFHRPQWKKNKSDQWIEVVQWDELIKKIAHHQSLFITAGQIEQTVLDQLARQSNQILLRTAMPVKIDLADNITWIKAIGPFQLEDEKQLLKQYKIDAIVSKNSGGDSTYAKIQAAAEVQIPVYQFKRPDLKQLQYQCDNQQSCLAFLLTLKDELSRVKLTNEI